MDEICVFCNVGVCVCDLWIVMIARNSERLAGIARVCGGVYWRKREAKAIALPGVESGRKQRRAETISSHTHQLLSYCCAI